MADYFKNPEFEQAAKVSEQLLAQAAGVEPLSGGQRGIDVMEVTQRT